MTQPNFGNGLYNHREKRHLSLQFDKPFQRPIYQPDNIENSPSKLQNKLSFDAYMKKRSYYHTDIDNTISIMQKIVASKTRETALRT